MIVLSTFITTQSFWDEKHKGFLVSNFLLLLIFDSLIFTVFKPELSNHFLSDKSAMLKGCGYFLKSLHLKPNSVKNPVDGIILTALHNVVETSVEDVVPPRYLGYQDLFYLGGLGIQ